MPDTVRTISALLTNLFQDGQGAGAITPQDLRDLIVSLSPPETVLTFGTTMTWNMDTDPVARVVLTGNSTITFSGGVAGRAYRLAIVQDATGNRVPSVTGATVVGTPVWATAGNGANLVSVDFVNATRYALVA